MIKVRFGNVKLPVSPGVLDDLLERSKNGEGDMETLLSKHVMEEISKEIKRKSEAMVNSCKLESVFANEVESKIEELSRINKNNRTQQGAGVLKPMEERDYPVPPMKEHMAPAAETKDQTAEKGNKGEIPIESKEERNLKGSKPVNDGGSHQENIRTKATNTAGVRENASVRFAGNMGGDMNKIPSQGMGEDIAAELLDEQTWCWTLVDICNCSRNSRGLFCCAGIYTASEEELLESTIKDMLQDCLHWCKRRMITRVVFESNEWSGYRNMELEEYTMNVGRVQCAERVNAVAQCLVNWGPGLNVVYWKKEGLPRGLGRILALEGIPHFVFGPGVDGI
nr:uncharacterized protein LOC109149028 [Ipomoea trifida]